MTRPAGGRETVSVRDGAHRVVVRQQVLAAARELFRLRGVRGVTMTDVAAAADTSRQMVYKIFFGRRELVQAAIVDRIEEIADAVAAGQDPSASESFTAAFVEVSVAVIDAIRNDDELMGLLGDGSPTTLNEALWSPELIERAMRFWEPWLGGGRARGIWRHELSDRDLADWLHTVYVAIILRPELPTEDERTLIEHFVLTSIVMATAPRAVPIARTR